MLISWKLTLADGLLGLSPVPTRRFKRPLPPLSTSAVKHQVAYNTHSPGVDPAEYTDTTLPTPQHVSSSRSASRLHDPSCERPTTLSRIFLQRSTPFDTHLNLPLSTPSPIQSPASDDQRTSLFPIAQSRSLVMRPSFLGLPLHMSPSERARIVRSPLGIAHVSHPERDTVPSDSGFAVCTPLDLIQSTLGGSILRNAMVAYAHRIYSSSSASNMSGPPPILADPPSDPSFQGQGSTPQLLPFLQSLRALHPRHLPILLLLSCVYYQAGDRVACLTTSQEMLRIDPNYVSSGHFTNWLNPNHVSGRSYVKSWYGPSSLGSDRGGKVLVAESN